MKKENLIYLIVFICATTLLVLAFTILSNTVFIGPIAIVFSLYLFIGLIIKLCKKSDKFKNTFFGIIDLLFWLP